MRLFKLACLLLATCISGSGQSDVPARITDLKPPVLLISIDGFRWDYLPRAKAPNLKSLAGNGVQAEALVPSFPTKTFPNHYTIVTGLYPPHHGIIANNMWDDRIGKKFTTENREQVQNPAWWGGEPIWVTAEKAGQRTAVMFWPGSEAAIQGVRPAYWQEHNSKITHAERLAFFFSHLDKPERDRPTFFTLYFQDVDDAGHDYGPQSTQVIAAVERVDRTLGELVRGLDQRGVRDKINIVIVSDHGMVQADPKRLIYLDDHIDLAKVRISDWSPVLALNAGNQHDEVLAALRKVRHLTAYAKQELPARLRYSGNDRIPPIIALAEPGWKITTRKKAAEWPHFDYGEHGYDNQLKDVWGIFIAAGPAFRSRTRIPPFENIHIYSALCSILGLPPAPNDGRLEVLAPALRAPVPPPRRTAPRTNAPRKARAADGRSQTAAQ